MYLVPFDEINKFGESLRVKYFNDEGKIKSREAYEDMLDEMLDLFLLAYANGVTATNLSLSSNYYPTLDEVMGTVDAKVADKTWRERMREYYENGGTVDDVVRIVETETHRIANTAALEDARKSGAKFKTWVTMMDDRVREQHSYLESETVGIDEDFYTYDGDFGQAPGLFQTAENNVNCRCELIFS